MVLMLMGVTVLLKMTLGLMDLRRSWLERFLMLAICMFCKEISMIFVVVCILMSASNLVVDVLC
eukprot:5867379-Amphidinium_carterae.1